MERLVLIDGNAILHRAYHALPPLTNKKGEPIQAVYGFCSMLLKVISDLKPSYLIVAFDRPKPTFREKIYKEYQATRPKMEENLVLQVDKVHQLVNQMGIPIYEMDGYEADDIIGTLASQAAQTQNLETIIVTGDRDILQLVNDKTKVYMLVKGLSEAKLYDEAEVRKKFGIAPSQIADFKALTGDHSDNYPGVTGVGPKTALKLLSSLKTLEQIYSNLERLINWEISDKIIETLKKEKDKAELSKQLATIVKEVEINFDPQRTRWHDDKEKIKQTLLNFGFQSLAKRVEKNSNKQTTNNQKQEKIEKDNNQLGLF